MKKLTYLSVFFILLFSFYNCSQENDLSKEIPVQSNYSIPSVKQTKQAFKQILFSKSSSLKSEKELNILWEKSSVKKYKGIINILYTPINLKTDKRIKSLVSSVKKEGIVESYILTLVYDKDSNNQAFSGYIFKHDSKGVFVEVYQYKQGVYVQTLRELNGSTLSNRGCSCDTSALEVVELLIDGWDVGTLLDCVCVGGTTGGDSSTFQEWSTPGSNLKDPIDWNLNHNNNLGGGGGSTTGNTSNSNNSISNELDMQGIDPWWKEEDDKIVNEITDSKVKCIHDKLTKNGNNFVKELLKNFKGKSEFNINIKSPKDIVNKDGTISKSRGRTSYVDGSKVINIQISANRMSTEKVLVSIKTILHEYIHAEMFRKLKTKFTPTNEILDFKKVYESFKQTNFQPTPQHESMAKLYVKSMAKALKDIHTKILIREYNYLSDDGTKSLDDLYEAIAWQGLKNHDVKAYKDLSDERKTELDKAFSKDYNRLTASCPD